MEECVISIKESKENQSLSEYKATGSTSSSLIPEKLNIWFPQCRRFTSSSCPYVKIKPSHKLLCCTGVLVKSFEEVSLSWCVSCFTSTEACVIYEITRRILIV